MKVLFIISNSDTAFWLSEVTHPYWHLTERGVEVDFASPKGGKVVYDPYSDPYFEHSTEADDLVSKGFLSDKALVAKTRRHAEAAGRRSWTSTTPFMWPADAARPSIFTRTTTWRARLNISGSKDQSRRRDLPRRHRARKYSRPHSRPPNRPAIRSKATSELQRMFGSGFLIPHYPQTVLEEAGALYSRVAPNDPFVVATASW